MVEWSKTRAKVLIIGSVTYISTRSLFCIEYHGYTQNMPLCFMLSQPINISKLKGCEVMQSFQDMLNSFLLGIPSLIYAVLLLILAFIVAKIAKNIVIKALKHLKFERFTDKLGVADEASGSSLEFIGKLVYIIVFLLFMPGVLSKLGFQGDATSPITSLVTQFFGYVPNIIAAAIIVAIGLFVARIIKQLLKPLLKRMNVDKIQEKAGIQPAENATLSSVISYIVYVIILVPIIIAALQVLNIEAISGPAISMLNKIFVFLPNIFVAIAIVIIGGFIATIVEKLLTNVLSGVGLDSFVAKILPEGKARQFSLAAIIGTVVKYIIILLFVVEAVNVIQLEVLRVVGQAIIAYLPFAISAILIIGLALLLASWAEKAIQKKFPESHMLALFVRSAIVVVAVLMSLDQLGIAPYIVNAAFILIVGALAVAFAIAFGVGGRGFAENILKKVEKTTYSSDDRLNR